MTFSIKNYGLTSENMEQKSHMDPFTKRHKGVDGRFPKFKVVYSSETTAKLIKIQ